VRDLRERASLKRFFEIDLLLRSEAVAVEFEERFSAPAEIVSSPGRAVTEGAGAVDRVRRPVAFALTWSPTQLQESS
jgi:hypothetical protein